MVEKESGEAGRLELEEITAKRAQEDTDGERVLMIRVMRTSDSSVFLLETGAICWIRR